MQVLAGFAAATPSGRVSTRVGDDRRHPGFGRREPSSKRWPSGPVGLSQCFSSTTRATMDAPDLAQIATIEMRANGFEPTFAPEVLREAEQRAQVGTQRSGDIRDLRGRQWFSIDNVDTLDLDQLTWAEALPDGSLRLAVAVANVDAMVHRGSSVDAHAAANTTSVYTAAGVFPTLPPLLSNDRVVARRRGAAGAPGRRRHAAAQALPVARRPGHPRPALLRR